MEGIVCHIGVNKYGKPFGLIKVADMGKSYYFDQRYLKGMSLDDLNRGDKVAFDKVERDDYRGARNVALLEKAEQGKEKKPLNWAVKHKIHKLMKEAYPVGVGVEVDFSGLDSLLRSHDINHEDYGFDDLTQLCMRLDFLAIKDISAGEGERSVALFDNHKKTKPLTKAVKNEIRELIKEAYPTRVRAEVNLSSLDSLLRSRDINHEDYGFDDLTQLCMKLDFLAIGDVSAGEGAQNVATLKGDGDKEEAPASFVYQYMDITDELRMEIYAFLLGKFPAGKQFYWNTIIRELSNAGYNSKKYGINNKRDFLECFSRFLFIEDLHDLDGKASMFVTINRIPEWEYDTEKDDGKTNPSNSITTPGFGEKVDKGSLGREEKRIVYVFAKLFRVTKIAQLSVDEQKKYCYCFLKPTPRFNESFNLHNEILLLFCNNPDFDISALGVMENILKHSSKSFSSRLDPVCSVFIGKDPHIVGKIGDFLKDNRYENQVIVPYSYSEIIERTEDENPAGDARDVVIQRFEKFFYTRDLFAFQAPVQKDHYFFGRQSFVHNLMDRYKSRQNTGVFGLRRSGKTSILYAMQRTLNRAGKNWLSIDCNSLQQLRWNSALHYIASEAYEKQDQDYPVKRGEFDVENAAIRFERDMRELAKLTDDEPLLVMFDEIEKISFEIADADHWKEGGDFVFFWSAVKTYFQNAPDMFSFIVTGTNPKAIESSMAGHSDNPLYQQLEIEYLPSFSIEDTEDMVNKLGAYMGLTFDKYVCTQLTTDFGGQPFVIRKFCSYVNAHVKKHERKKPLTITKASYDLIKNDFMKTGELDDYFEMIMTVLMKSYQKEYDILINLALEDYAVINELPNRETLISHLTGYGIVERDGEILGFKYDTLKYYLVSENKFKRKNMSSEDRIAEVNARARIAERELKNIAKAGLVMGLGEEKARKAVLNELGENAEKYGYGGLSYGDLFSSLDVHKYFSTYINIIRSNWPWFRNTFASRSDFEMHMKVLLNMRNFGAHPDGVEMEVHNFESFRNSIEWFGAILKRNGFINALF